LLAAAALVVSACGSGDDSTAPQQSSAAAETAEVAETAEAAETTTTETASAESTSTTTEPEATTTTQAASSETAAAGDAVPIDSMAPSEIESLIERIGCEIHPDFGRGSGMVAFFLGGFGPEGDPPVEPDADTSFLCSTGGDLSIVGLAMNDAADAKAMATWLASADSGACRDIGFAGSWTFLYATSEDPPDTVRLPEVMALYGGDMEVVCPTN